jgi:integrase
LAVKQGLLERNPLDSLPPLKSTRMEKGIFSPEEIVRLVAAATLDWKGGILAGYFTGARLKDVCNLRWGNVDLAKKIITFRAGKTGQRITVAIHPELEEHLLTRTISDDPQAFLFPTLAKRNGGGGNGLSMEFTRLMKKSGIEPGTARLRAGTKGKTFALRSFHSLRHSFVSALANSGVSVELRQKLSGHLTEEMNQLYTHAELQVLRQAVAAIPRLPGR